VGEACHSDNNHKSRRRSSLSRTSSIVDAFTGGGILLSLSPMIHSVVLGDTPLFESDGGVLWSFIYMISVAPGAVLNVMQEKYMKIRTKETVDIPERSNSFDKLVMLMWSCVSIPRRRVMIIGGTAFFLFPDFF